MYTTPVSGVVPRPPTKAVLLSPLDFMARLCALVVNELVGNACKHAFGARRRGTVDLVLEAADSGELVVRVRDDGVGLPAGFDPEAEGHLGWSIVRNLVRDDLRGTLKLESSAAGTTVTITIPPEKKP